MASFSSDSGDRGIVRDMNGHLLQHPVCGDTHTGWVECLATDSKGQFLLNVDGSVRRALRRYLAPLSVEDIPPGWDSRYEQPAKPLEEKLCPIRK
jgi:hypothetical protein